MINKLSIPHKIIYIVNILAAFMLLISFILPYINPDTLPAFALLGLTVPVLILINLLFTIYWLYKLKYHFILSAIVIFLSCIESSPIYNISNKNNIDIKDMSIMSFNVRVFNKYKQIKEDGIDLKILDFIAAKKPNIVAFQEFNKSYFKKLDYNYKYFISKSKYGNFGLAIFSDYKIINKGSLDFTQSTNNSIFIDIIKHNDTIRIYNVHLQSLNINPYKENFGRTNSLSLMNNLMENLKKQANQVSYINKHQQYFKGKKIICGDFNNTAYSWVYKQLRKGKKDAFIEAGNGTGKTFNYYLPMRIDFLLIDKKIKINNFEKFSKKYSDHEPILCYLSI